jgi:endonuclease G, mitochondrial
MPSRYTLFLKTTKVSLRLIVIIMLSIAVTGHCNGAPTIDTGMYETFEDGSKSAYAPDTVTFSSGLWRLDNTLVGSSASDRKIGSRAVRMRDSGTLTMMFNVTNGAASVSLLHGLYGSDTNASWSLWYSVNSGSSWRQIASAITTNSASLQLTTFTISISGPVRFEIRKHGGGRLNIDNVNITPNYAGCIPCGSVADTTPRQDDNLAMGNPSMAPAVASDSNNYLITKHQYSLCYNNSKGIANWVSWHLSSAWKGSADRCDCFGQDTTLPGGYFRASTSHYTGTGFDRGHLCPSDDRDLSDSDNAATFRMTNIAPQAPNLNQNTWGDLEDYCRTLISSGNELYIIAGSYGSGGSGSLGGTTYSIGPSGRISIPAHYWKAILVLPNGINDVSRVDTTTRIIAVDMPNVQSVSANAWSYYRTSTDAIEAATGLDLFSNVLLSTQAAIESIVDSGPTH